jgi:fucose 4-O-acetylase-like acetyltransferase
MPLNLLSDACRKETPLRAAWVDCAKGLGILFVVYAHVLRGLVPVDVIHAQSWLLATDYFIYLFHMPLFFFVAGFFAEKSVGRGARGFLAAKGRALAYPYVLWSVLFIVVHTAAAGHTNRATHFSDIPRIFVDPPGAYWFLYALVLCHMACFGLRRLGASREAVVAVAFALFIVGQVLPDDLLIDIFVDYFFYFALGLYGLQVIERMNRPGLAGLGVVAFLVAGAAVYVLQDGVTTLRLNAPVRVMPALLGIAATCLVVTRLPEGKIQAALAACGRVSLGIYVMHIIFAPAFRTALLKAHVLSPVLHLAGGTLLGLALPMLVMAVAQRLKIASWLGLPGRVLIPERALLPLKQAP